MKETFWIKMKRKWNELEEGERGMAIGGVIGAITTSIISAFVMRKREDHILDNSAAVSYDMCKKEYMRGLTDGEIKAYQTLILNPDKAFKKMGMEVKHF